MKSNDSSLSREKTIFRASLTGIGVNLLLAAVKAVIGILSNSIAILLDALNNLSDALSSVITILGMRFAMRAPDKKHPLGYGRSEYLSALLISFIVLYAGVSSLIESVKKILHPEVPEYTALSLGILALAVLAKIGLGTYMKNTGKAVNSASLQASGADAMNDAVISASVIASALLYMFTGISLEAWVGAVISVLILRSGLELVRDTLDDILGKRPDSELTKAVKQTIAEEENVFGAYDLILHSYGPDRMVGSVHIEVPEDLSIRELDAIERRITDRVLSKFGIALGGISIYCRNISEEPAASIREEILKIVDAQEGVQGMHGFYFDEEKKRISFDAVLEYRNDKSDVFRRLCRSVQEAFPDYEISISMDNDLSD